MKNRIPRYPGRIKLSPVDAANGIYDLTRADEPEVEGTPLAKKLLDFAVAACGVTAGTGSAYTLDGELVDGFTLSDGAKVNFKLHTASEAGATLNVGGTGAKALRTVIGDGMAADIPAGTWMTVVYSSEIDAYILGGNAISADKIAVWDANWEVISKTTLTAAAMELQIELPIGYRQYRITFQGGTTQYLQTRWDVGFDFPATVAYDKSYINFSDKTITKTRTYGTTSLWLEIPTSNIYNTKFVQLLMSPQGSEIKINGEVRTTESLTMFSGICNAGSVQTIKFRTTINGFNVGCCLIVEGIR